ncbi:hypothetical protein KQI82_02570 [Oscillibacter sp. MSJ-2]|uniref:DUF3221 domain-containing protein n=1 Tax=Dysosmobacter acutus TaxID=2841504 RepID=A0ABS6F692_9FIRM|nr:hypothetical protein [Dysosmobacter acutus]MBU5625819.1 hypothetical protein [Dysosmobacter acutus]
MKKRGIIVICLVAVLFTVAHMGRSSIKETIDGKLVGYVQVKEYTKPLAVVESSGKTFYIALLSNTVAIDETGVFDNELLERLLNGNLTDIRIHVEEAEKGKTVSIDGKKETVWQVYQIYKKES